MRKLVSILTLIGLFTAGANFQLAHADAGPTIAITTPSGVVKGLTSIAVNTAVDPTGSAKLKAVAIVINGLPYYEVAITSASSTYYGSNSSNCTFGTLSTSNICWTLSQTLASSTYTFFTDTTSWPSGSYQVTAYIKDSNDRVAASPSITLTTANAGPTIAITTPSGVVKGLTSIAVNTAVDPTGSAKLKAVAIVINGLPYYEVAITSASSTYYGSNSSNCTFGTLSTSNICWTLSQTLASSTYTFFTDTTSWPSGSYQVTAYIKDSNDRVAASSSVNLIIPVAPKLNLTIAKVGVDSPSTFNLVVSGVKSIGEGTVVLQASEYGEEDSEWETLETFSGPIGAMSASASVPLGYYVRAFFSGATELLDAPSRSIQVLVTPKITCKLASSARVGKKIVGKCTSNITLPGVYVTLQTSTGRKDHTLHK